jgi:hypothetical protein
VLARSNHKVAARQVHPEVSQPRLLGCCIRSREIVGSWSDWRGPRRDSLHRAEIHRRKRPARRIPQEGGARSSVGSSGSRTTRGYRLLKQLRVDGIREFRNSFMKRYAASSAGTKARVRPLILRFCQASRWMSANPAVAVKAPRSTESPHSPLRRSRSREHVGCRRYVRYVRQVRRREPKASKSDDSVAPVFRAADLRRLDARAITPGGSETVSLHAEDRDARPSPAAAARR